MHTKTTPTTAGITYHIYDIVSYFVFFKYKVKNSKHSLSKQTRILLAVHKVVAILAGSVGRYHDTTVEPRYRGTEVLFHGTSAVEVTVLPWYRNTTNTAVLPYGTCQQIVISAKIFERKKTVW